MKETTRKILELLAITTSGIVFNVLNGLVYIESPLIV